MRFSQRIGKKSIKTQVQLESMDNDLRVGLWNLFKVFYIEEMEREQQLRMTNKVEGISFNTFFMVLWHSFFKWPLHSISPYLDSACNQILAWFGKAEWHEVYDFIEFVGNTETRADAGQFRDACNSLLEREVSAYRFVGNEIAPITSANELAEIEGAFANTQVPLLAGVSEHLESALAKLSDRRSPDYRNSIKESISAVESVCRLIAGDRTTLGQALKQVKDKVGLHPALEKGFSSLYGWTNDAGGIRHALMDDSLPCDFEDAKYMLVSCSAFTNYLLAKAAKAGISLG